MLSLPVGADRGGQKGSWLLPGALEGILCTKEGDCALCHLQVFPGVVEHLCQFEGPLVGL